jgi:hypothetical protein
MTRYKTTAILRDTAIQEINHRNEVDNHRSIRNRVSTTDKKARNKNRFWADCATNRRAETTQEKKYHSFMVSTPPKAAARKHTVVEIDVEGANDFRSVYCRAVGRGQKLTSSTNTGSLSKLLCCSVGYVCTPYA